MTPRRGTSGRKVDLRDNLMKKSGVAPADCIVVDDATKEKASPKSLERCAVCGITTMTRRSTPIQYRPLYVDGIGEICYRCYNAS